MLVKITDHKGKVWFINAAYIKTIAPKGESLTDIYVSGATSKIRVREPAESVAQIINTAMPSNFEALLATEEQKQQDDTAAIIAVIG